MDLNLQSPSPDDADGKPSFRKPSNEAAHRKYRRHSPVNESPSSSSGSLKHGRSSSPPFTRDDLAKSSYDSRKRKDDGREMHMDSGRSRSDKDGDSYRSSERHSYRRSRNYSRHDDYSGYHSHANEENNYKRSSGSGRVLRSGTSDYTRREGKVDKTRDHRHNVDNKYTRERHDDFNRNTGKERDIPALERQKPKERHSSSDRVTSDRRPTGSNLDEVKTGGRDRRDRDRERDRDDMKGYHRNSGEYKSNYTSLSDSRVEGKDSTTSKDRSGSRLKETLKTNTKELDRENDEVMEKGKHDDRESDRLKGRYGRGLDEKGNRSFTCGEGNGRDEQHEDRISNKDHESSGKRLKLNSGSGNHNGKDGQLIPKSVSVAGEGPPSNSKQAPDAVVNVLANSAQSSANEANAADGINAARVAAMKAAELVNKNLVGGGYMSTDQKKKLLWGNKKSTAAEEPVHRWDIPLFSDRERQEKFNKLMGVKGDVKPEQNQNGEEGNGGLAEKQEQLQLDLEKQYTAGLRRRDGRTVGLGGRHCFGCFVSKGEGTNAMTPMQWLERGRHQ